MIPFMVSMCIKPNHLLHRRHGIRHVLYMTLRVTPVVTKLQRHHKKGLYAAKFSEEHENIIGTVSSDNTCRLWRLDNGKQLAKLAGHDDEVNGMAFHKNKLATASDDRAIIIWDIETYQPIAKLEGHRNSVYGLCFQPAGHTQGGLLASVAFDWMTLIWDQENTRAPVRTLEGHRDDIIGVDFAPNGIALATGSDDGTCRIWDCRMWRSTAVLEDHEGECKRVYSLIWACFSNNVRGWHCKSMGYVHIRLYRYA